MIPFHRRTLAASICLAAFTWGCGPANAITVGNVDTFQGGSADGWYLPEGTPLPLLVFQSGGPAGSGDGYLQLRASGQSGPGSRLVVFGSTDWLGNYIAAGVRAIEMDAINQGPDDLQLRMYFNSPAGSALSTVAVTLPAGGSWTHLVFPTLPAALSGANTAGTLADVREFRLFHNDTPSFPPSAVLGTLGIDNVSAVPEPATLLLWAAGAAMLPAVRRRGRRGA